MRAPSDASRPLVADDVFSNLQHVINARIKLGFGQPSRRRLITQQVAAVGTEPSSMGETTHKLDVVRHRLLNLRGSVTTLPQSSECEGEPATRPGCIGSVSAWRAPCGSMPPLRGDLEMVLHTPGRPCTEACVSKMRRHWHAGEATQCCYHVAHHVVIFNILRHQCCNLFRIARILSRIKLLNCIPGACGRANTCTA